MPLEMRTACERCGRPLTAESDAYICSYECTYCGDCCRELQGKCNNCGNELTRRPRKLGVRGLCEPAPA